MFDFILPFIVLILVVVFIHEYGHYYFAKRYGVGVTDFSIGFGQEIFGWNDKSGTRWKICWIPLGGYVKFFGDRNVFSQADQEKIIKKYNEEDRKKLFALKPLYQDLNTPGYIANLHQLFEKANKGENKELFISACKFIGLFNEDNEKWENYKKIKV